MAQHNDAFGKPISDGHQYAYSTGNSGVTYVVLGTVERQGEKKVTIRVQRELCYCYGKPSAHDEYRSKDSLRSVYSCILFPFVEQSVEPSVKPTQPQSKDDDSFVLEA